MSNHPQPPLEIISPPRAPNIPLPEPYSYRRSARILAQRRSQRSDDLSSTGSPAKNAILNRTSRSKASSKRSVSKSSIHRTSTPCPTAPIEGLCLTEDNLLAHTLSTDGSPHPRGVSHPMSVQLGNSPRNIKTSSSTSLDTAEIEERERQRDEEIAYFTEKKRRRKQQLMDKEEAFKKQQLIEEEAYMASQGNHNDEFNQLTTPQLIEKVDQTNPGWRGASPIDLTAGPFTPNPEETHNSYDPHTPPLNKHISLDVDKTPHSPAVTRANAQTIHALKLKDKEINPLYTTNEQAEEEFETSVMLSKVTTNHIIVDNFPRPSTPTPNAPNTPTMTTLTFEHMSHIRALWGELLHYYVSFKPDRVTNYHVMAEPAYEFIMGYKNTDWCDVPVSIESTRTLFAHNNTTSETNAAPPLANDSTNMDVADDPSPNTHLTPATLPPTSIPHTESNRLKEFPALASAKPIITLSPIHIGKPKPFANIPAKIVKKGPAKQKSSDNPMGKISGPPTAILPKINSLGAPPSTAAIVTSPPSKTPAKTPTKLSYAQAAVKASQDMPFTEESLHFIANLDKSFSTEVKEAIIKSLPRLPPPKPSPKPTNPKASPTPKSVAISKGPSRKSAIFALDGTLHATMLENIDKTVEGMNSHLIVNQANVRVERGCLTNNSFSLTLNAVPSHGDFIYLQASLIRTLGLLETPEDALIPYSPQSEAHLILKGFNYYTTPKSTRPEDVLTGQQVIDHLSNNSWLNGLSAVRTPRVIKSKGSNDMAVVFLDVWDSQNGINTKHVVNKAYHVNGKLIRIEYARPREFVPQCQKCWAWTHGTKACRLNHYRCPKCHGGHQLENHNLFAECCNDTQSQNNGIVKECLHPSKCRNCGENHPSNDFSCVYNLNKHNKKWHQDKIAESKANCATNIKAALKTASPPIPSS